MLENFFNTAGEQFSEVYFKVFSTNSNNNKVSALVIKSRSIGASLPARQMVNSIKEERITEHPELLLKVRKIFFKRALPSYKRFIANILKRAWLSKVNQSAYDAQNGLRMAVNIYETANYLTKSMEQTFGFKYTISINGQDPKFLGIQEPIFEDYIRETTAENVTEIEFCPSSSTFETDRFYVACTDDLNSKLGGLFGRVWLDSNQMIQAKRSAAEIKERISQKLKFDDFYFNSKNEKICRVGIAWLVDGAEPNPIYYKRPNVTSIVHMLDQSQIKLFTDIPYVKSNIDIIAYKDELNSLLKSSIKSAWHTANPNMDENYFDIFIEHEDQNNTFVLSKMKSLEDEEGVNVFIGIDDEKYDVADIKQPSMDIIKRSIKEKIPSAMFASEQVYKKQESFQETSTMVKLMFCL